MSSYMPTDLGRQRRLGRRLSTNDRTAFMLPLNMSLYGDVYAVVACLVNKGRC